MSLPTHQKTLKIKDANQIEYVEQGEMPVLEADEVLVKTACVAINPFDGKSADLSPSIGSVPGCDFSGEVVLTGSGVTGLSKGSRVCGCVFGNNPDRLSNGAFAEYVAAPADLLLRVPDDMSFDVAASLGVGISTVGMALYRHMKLPFMDQSNSTKGRWALVSGGATATGSLAIQIFKEAGFKVATTCSPRHFDMVKDLGAQEAFDYASPTCGDSLRQCTKNKLGYVLDCITTADSMKLCYEAIGSAGGRYISLDPFPLRCHTRRSVKPDWVLSLTQYGKPINWVRPFNRDARPQDRQLAREWFEMAQSLIDGGFLKPHPVKLQSGGLERVADGVAAVKRGEVRGQKLVFAI